DGATWTELSTRLPSSCKSVWGATDGSMYCAGLNGLLASRGPSGWKGVPTGTTEDLFDVWGSSPTDIWVAGANATLLRGNGTQQAPVTVPLGSTLLDISGTSASDVWIVTRQNGVMRWDGALWSVVADDAAVIDGNSVARVWAQPGGNPVAYRIGHRI